MKWIKKIVYKNISYKKSLKITLKKKPIFTIFDTRNNILYENRSINIFKLIKYYRKCGKIIKKYDLYPFMFTSLDRTYQLNNDKKDFLCIKSFRNFSKNEIYEFVYVNKHTYYKSVTSRYYDTYRYLSLDFIFKKIFELIDNELIVDEEEMEKYKMYST